MRITRRAAGIALAVAVLVIAAPDALAHGGNFRVGNPNPGAPGAGVPVIGPPSPVPVITPPSGGRRPTTPRGTWTPGNWSTWWSLNATSLLPLRGQYGPRPVITPGESIWGVGGAGAGARAVDPEEQAREIHRDLALPFLLRLVDPRSGEREPLVAVALLALARSARDSTPIAILEHWAFDRRASLEVRESAVLGLGLLRRTRPSEQMPLHRILRNRELLLGLFDDERQPTRLRAFSLFALALLADQPYGANPIEADGKLVTRALWQRISRRYASADLPAALFTALSMQPPAGIPSTILQSLERIALGKGAMRRKWDARERADATLTLARLGGDDACETLVEILGNRRHDHVVQAAASIGLAHRAEKMHSARRGHTVMALRRRVDRDRHAAVRGLSMITMGHLLRADLQAGSVVVLDSTDVAEYLEREARKGSTQTRPFAALALGLSVHGVEGSSRKIFAYQTHVREVMEWGLERGRGQDATIGAFAVGAGLSRAEQAIPALVDIVENPNRGHALRGDAALALGQIGRRTKQIDEILLAAARERVAAYVHLQAVRALSILGSEGAVEEILSQFRGKPTRGALVAVAQSLGRLRDPDATSRLVAMATDERTGLYVRVACVMALGLLFDREERPSRRLLTTNANYPAMTASLAQVFNIV